ncbi:MAG: class I SAM-dependent methyltransferase [Prevotella sp.]|jgi:ubiquinone/menaquinone biosynthesis C-methylase UbiE|nr:class I SAM-dependent methyltransferase [Prevotella sp.]
MSKDIQYIHEFDFSLISSFFKRIDRQGPGSPQVTKRALSFIDNLPVVSRIADIGCGSGGQTITLAENAEAHITALDLLPDFVAKLNGKIKDLKLENRIETIEGSMAALPFSDGELDLIWAEGSIYNIGFEKGLCEWHRFLKDHCYIAVSEASWLRDNQPAEIQEFWQNDYPDIDTVSNKVKIMEKAGYVPVAHFVLPEDSWIKNFYEPMPPAMESFLKEHDYSIGAKEFVKLMQHEIDMYMKYKEYYGYVFYIGKKI